MPAPETAPASAYHLMLAVIADFGFTHAAKAVSVVL
jgi:hypothetical protein